jgi:hypothetical protein
MLFLLSKEIQNPKHYILKKSKILITEIQNGSARVGGILFGTFVF